MIITIASFKGGVAKTTTAVHLAAYLQDRSPTLLIDGDPNRSATGWSRRASYRLRSWMKDRLPSMRESSNTV
jgi:chromosome partitioning protein